jgi:iron complex outermembrane receptor protein
VDARPGEFAARGARTYLPAYAKTDVHAGLRYGTWSVDLFGNNLADRRGILTRGQDTGGPPYSVTYIQPRTVGLNVTKSF